MQEERQVHGYFVCLYKIGPLAHAWLEQRTHNPLVPCSTHGRPTNEFKDLGENLGPFFASMVWSGTISVQ